MTKTNTTNLKSAARKYVSENKKAIFPLTPLGKVPQCKNGHKDATLMLDIVEDWWKKEPNCNIGMPTGEFNGFNVLDADLKNGGDKVLKFLKALFPSIEHSVRSSTGGGGEHIFFKYDPNQNLSNKAGIFQGIDVRGKGGYVVVPPSKHESGRFYEWINDLSYTFQEMPEGLLILLKDPNSKNYLKLIPKGERNQSLFDLIMFLRRNNVLQSDEFTLDVLKAANIYLCDEQVPESEIFTLFSSIKNYKVDNPKVKDSKKEPHRILKICLEHGTLFKCRGSGYIKLLTGTSKTPLPYLIQSRDVKLKITQEYYKTYKKTVSDASMKEGLQSVEAMAIYDSLEEEVFVRVASAGSSRYVDLLHADQMVKIAEGKWELVPIEGINFLRKPGMEKMAIPKCDQDFELLKSDLFSRWESWDGPNLLILSWIIKSLTHDTGPYPILVLTGVQGSGKSFFSRFIKSLVDPNLASLRSGTKKEEDFILSTSNAHVIAIDNNSGLSGEQADWYCRLSTGGGFSSRRLYTNDEEYITYSIKPVMINGINTPSSRGDFLERSLVIELPKIEIRESEREITKRLDLTKDKILGSLLTLLAQASEILNQIQISDLPRMADFCTWGVAIEKVLNLPEGTFLRVYKENQATLTEAVLDSSCFAQALISYISSCRDNSWSGSATELLNILEMGEFYPKDFSARKFWPNSPESVGKLLNRISPALDQQGILVSRTKREIIIKKVVNNDYTHKFNKSFRDGGKRSNVGGDNDKIF